MELTKEQRDFVANMITLGLSLILALLIITLGLSLILALLIGTIALKLIIESLPETTQQNIANINLGTIMEYTFENIKADIKMWIEVIARCIK